MEEHGERRIIVKNENYVLDRSPCEYVVHKKIKTEPDDDIGSVNLKIKREVDAEVKQEYEDSLAPSKIDSPESLCEVSMEEKYYRCPYCLFETNIRKYMKIHLASGTHLFKSCAAAENFAFELEAGSDLFKRSSETSAESIFDRYKRACDEISTVKAVSYNLETVPQQQVIPHILLCKICGYEAISGTALSKHAAIEHRPVLSPELSPYKRPRSERDLVGGNNCKSKYSRTEKVVCDVCAYQAKDGIDLKVHKLKHRDVSELLRHKCAYCEGDGWRCQIRKNKYARGRVEFID